eukprot:1080783-Pyramimonas_sp.AAC.1
MAGALNMKKLAGDVHAVWKTLRHPRNVDKISAVATGIVRDMLILPGPPPDPRWRAHAREVLSHTILRVMDHTRGSITKLTMDGDGD